MNLDLSLPFLNRISGYQCFTKERLAETPPRSFKDIGAEWKALSDSERGRYQEKADKVRSLVVQIKLSLMLCLSLMDCILGR